MHLRLTKHEGLGNDFLVLLDLEGDVALPPDAIRRLCDRHRGVGADGLMRATRGKGTALAGRFGGADGSGGSDDEPQVDAVMELYNADGTRAEMSGNGIRCLAQALLLEEWAQPPEVSIATDAGVRVVTVVEGPSPEPDGRTTQVLSVDMGSVEVQGDAAEWALEPSGGRAAWATAGNPHLVVEVADAAGISSIDLVELGEKVNAVTSGGANVHLLAVGEGQDTITIRTYERGVGLTEACGTGACASAVVAARWALVGGPGGRVSEGGPQRTDGLVVTVDMPGGRAQVTVGTGESVTLTGPATSIASVEYPWPTTGR